MNLKKKDESSPGFADRDLISFHIFGDHGIGPGGRILKLAEVGYTRDRFHFKNNSVGFVPIGKDGTAKHRNNVPVSNE